MTRLSPRSRRRVRGIAAAGGHGRIDGAFMSRFPKLEIVSSFGVGYDHIDAKWAGEHGIVVTNTPDVLNEEVADTALGLLLCTVRHLPQAERYLRDGQWPVKGDYQLTPSLRDRTAGIVGMGRIGKAIARRLDAMQVPVVYHSRRPRRTLPTGTIRTSSRWRATSTCIIVITPGGAATKNLVNAEVLKALGPDGILINVARGSVVDEAALIKALQDKTILSAGLDVFADEPKVPQELIDMDNVVLLPHVGSASHATRRAMDAAGRRTTSCRGSPARARSRRFPRRQPEVAMIATVRAATMLKLVPVMAGLLAAIVALAQAPAPLPEPNDVARVLVARRGSCRIRTATGAVRSRSSSIPPRPAVRSRSRRLRRRVFPISAPTTAWTSAATTRSEFSTPRARCCSSSARSRTACTRPRRATRTTSCRRSPRSGRSASPTTCSATGSSRAAARRSASSISATPPTMRTPSRSSSSPAATPLVTRFAPVAWRFDRGQFVMLDAKGQSWRFEENDESAWSRIPAMRPPLTMVRPPQPAQ